MNRRGREGVRVEVYIEILLYLKTRGKKWGGRVMGNLKEMGTKNGKWEKSLPYWNPPSGSSLLVLLVRP